MKLAFDGITSFSYKPLMLAGYLGGLSLFIGIVSIIVEFTKCILQKTSMVNFGLIISIDLIMFGIILSCMGIIGQYIGRIFDESKGRPNYVIENIVNKKKE
jgi:dolichol-phosphate mannosyltransferase